MRSPAVAYALLCALAGLCAAAAEGNVTTGQSAAEAFAAAGAARYSDPCRGTNGTLATGNDRRVRGNATRSNDTRTGHRRLAAHLRGGARRTGPGAVARADGGADGGEAVPTAAPTFVPERCGQRKGKGPRLYTFLAIAVPINLLLGAYFAWRCRVRNRAGAKTVADSDATAEERRDEIAKFVSGLQPATAEVHSDDVCAICLGALQHPASTFNSRRHGSLDDSRHGLDDLRHGLDTLRRGLDNSRRGLDTLRRGLDTSRNGRDTSRHGLDDSRRGLGTSRNDRATSRKGLDDSRRGLDTSRNGLDTSRNGPDDSRRGLDTSRNGRDTSRNGLDDSRRGLDTSRNGRDTSRKGLDDSRRGLDTSRNGLDDSRRGLDTSRHGRDTSRHGRDTSRQGLDTSHNDLDTSHYGVDDGSGSLDLVRLPHCSHVFHRGCVSGWVATANISAGKPQVFYGQRALSCPICSAPLLEVPTVLESPTEGAHAVVLEAAGPAAAPVSDNA
ncbi:hypothetical protein M885DRAFT_548507 [Pelagophyceae sp. CCMP2097]|nr:hypothetical protein M885DRAFT_548507 [Pelagophyceae sp. CCMP2097]